ncbi:hypothetical protein B0I37DRAFT_393624 [Chaetomium sp. MPI-CAGE-AT-0009]|nr:hypothetical protein B0I37DRAFT_393624 [Chaetomium sp. MPI-CAGE-AT-0009]
MTAEFHFFPLLPWELREKIWKLVIRPALPAAHVFRLCNREDLERTPEHKAFTDDDNDVAWCLASPQCLPRGVDFSPAARDAAPISWTLNNPSTYLIDSGLWTACKESMLIIEREFQAPARRRREWSLSDVESFRAERGRFTLPETATYKTFVNSSLRYLTVFPVQDLLILKPPDITDLDSRITYNIFPSLWGSCYLNAAFEYDPAWDRIHTNPGYDFSSAHAFCVWFIDYRIKRNPRYPETTKEQAQELGGRPATVFYANDSRFVEVNERLLGRVKGHDRMWDAGYEVPTEEDEDLCSCYGSGGFVARLQDYLDGEWDYYKRDWYSGNKAVGWITYGLLACEYV